jgi:hypothetical protein
MALYDDGSLYDGGSLYVSLEGVPFEYLVEREVHCHRVSARINYTAQTTPGFDEAFRIHDIRLRVAPDSQSSFTHEAFIDGTTPSERLAARVTHTGSEFIISNIQLFAQRKKHQPKS